MSEPSLNDQFPGQFPEYTADGTPMMCGACGDWVEPTAEGEEVAKKEVERDFTEELEKGMRFGVLCIPCYNKFQIWAKEKGLIK